jgi:hypothetical protein
VLLSVIFAFTKLPTALSSPAKCTNRPPFVLADRGKSALPV